VTRTLAKISLGIALGLLVAAYQAHSHNLPGTKHNREHAITHAFCHSLKPCALGNKALSVAYCESGPNLWPWARNHDYWGMFQVSGHWRATVPGWGWGPWHQARHAYRVYRITGSHWGHWSCA
jgi:hypothetical protein